MKFALLALLLIGNPISMLCQEQSRDDIEKSVRQALQEAAKQRYTGWTQKTLELLGDASAVSLIEIYGDRDLTVTDIKSALLVIDLSFSSPRLVARESDRKPRATMLLLKYLECQTNQAELKQQIEEARKSMKSRAP